VVRHRFDILRSVMLSWRYIAEVVLAIHTLAQEKYGIISKHQFRSTNSANVFQCTTTRFKLQSNQLTLSRAGYFEDAKLTP